MSRPVGYLSLVSAFVCAGGVALVRRVGIDGSVQGVAVSFLLVKVLSLLAVSFATYGCYRIALGVYDQRTADKRRRHDARNLFRLGFGAAGTVAALGVLTEQWVGLLFSLGVVGFAVTFALQQPLFSLIGWLYIMVKRPYQVGDRVAIEDSKGDVVEVSFLVTTLWEINGGLVSSNQPSGRSITLPNSVVLSSHVKNYTREEFPYVWNELTVQVAYETDFEFATETMRTVADDYLGDEMAARIERYRERLAETPVELEVQDRPTVNVVQEESWVAFRLRYLVHPRRGQRVRNELYRRVLAAFNEHPDRVKFPVSRNR
ncbi:mechanosensitive ion channel family protein [Haloarcula nitratireducens]|uniref:Mechanosensitive ion channel family protein n=1 Tax=Haloarcula nitratireducens TaxID=2487749 RepID=A0AAW4P9U4_9EURY|nr:mechanosensitive ion channel domain-containing protein [Halomicroarcula nitratireducens]MBX0294675.1 mechanosensitive ion channel family protein [Halomicroarcula nitratireducens]